MSKAIDELKDEHQAILSSLRILDKFSAAVNEGLAPEPADLAALVGFLGDFAGRCHHGKEEEVLFPALYGVGLSEHSDPIAQILSEHLLGRDYVRDMHHALSSGPDYLTFAYAARGYSSLLRGHVRKEDSVLFPMAEKILDPVRLGRMCSSFKEYQQSLFAQDRHAQLHEMLRGLRLKYLE